MSNLHARYPNRKKNCVISAFGKTNEASKYIIDNAYKTLDHNVILKTVNHSKDCITFQQIMIISYYTVVRVIRM